MASWPEEKKFDIRDVGNISVSNELEDDNLELCFNNVYEQLPVINYSKYSDENGRPENATYIGKLEGQDENAG